MVRWVRVTEPHIVRDPENEHRMVVPDPRNKYREDDPLVQAYPWMFAGDDDEDRPVRVRGVESAANDGSQMIRRGPGRPRKSAEDE